MEKIPIRHLSEIQKEPDFSGNFSIRNIEVLLAGKEMVQELHRHDFFYILALKYGSGNHDIDFIPYIVSDHSIFFMRPGQVHQLVLKAGSEGYLMQFRDDFYLPHDKASSQLLRKASSNNHYKTHHSGFQKLLTVLTNIGQEYADKLEGYQDVIKANLDILFIEIIRLSGRSLSDHVNLYSQERFEELLAHIETHIFSSKRVSEYASIMNLSTYQLNTITQETIGKTCSEVINEHIILEAKRFLLATSNQINQIADHLGYDDVSYFIRFFKKHTGHSPESFRRNFK
ncbi:MAG: helix-turn-helix protein [Daejeonella sp.]|nr:helix-turn-helix protein [Daejeonella sp.]